MGSVHGRRQTWHGVAVETDAQANHELAVYKAASVGYDEDVFLGQNIFYQSWF